MSCKYCEGREPLDMAWNLKLTIERPGTHKKASITFTDGNHTVHRYIDYCPVCGDEIRPFGPAWMHAE